MITLGKIRPLWWLLIGFGLFLVSVSFVVRFAREERDLIQRAQQTHTQLQGLIESAAARREALQHLAEGEAQAVKQVLRNVSVNGTVTYENPNVRELPDGYRHHQVRVNLSGVNPQSIHEILRHLENARPPWRVTGMELEIRDGALEGALHLEVLDMP